MRRRRPRSADAFAGEEPDEVLGGGAALVDGRSERAGQRLPPAFGELGDAAGEVRRSAAGARGAGAHRGVGEGKLAGEHLVGDDAQCVDVRRRSEWRARGLFRGHVRGRADVASGAGERALSLAHGAGHAEVGDHDPGAAVRPGDEEHVAALEVAVEHAVRVGGAERGGHLAEERLGLLGAEAPAAGEGGGERLAVEQLHHQEEQLAELAGVGEELVDAADVGVGDRASEEHLAPDALRGRRARRRGGPSPRHGRGACGPRPRRRRPCRRGR